MPYTFYGQGVPPVDQFLFEKYFPKKIKGTFIECGAFDGILDSNCLFFERFREWQGINVEPVPSLYELLKENRPQSINVNLALSSKNGRLKFHQAIHPIHGNYFGNGSLQHSEAHREELNATGCTFTQLEVEVMTIEQLLKKSAPWFHSIDLFVLDVEGHEIDVLQGFYSLPKGLLPSLLCVEYPHTGLDELINFLRQFNYRLDAIIPNSAGSFNNAIFINSLNFIAGERRRTCRCFPKANEGVLQR